MDSPLRRARITRQKTLQEVSRECGMDVGNLSRIERGEQTPGKDVLDRIVTYFGGAVTEMEVLFPERYVGADDRSAA